MRHFVSLRDAGAISTATRGMRVFVSLWRGLKEQHEPYQEKEGGHDIGN
jgi:hypothetical protein